MKSLADSLRDLPGQQRTFLHLPRLQVGTEWSRWLQNYDPMPRPGGWQFRFWYCFHPFAEWNAEQMCNRLSELWRMWGWDCTVDNESPLSGYRLTASSPDSYELTFRARPQRQKSCIEIVLTDIQSQRHRACLDAVRCDPVRTSNLSYGVGALRRTHKLVTERIIYMVFINSIQSLGDDQSRADHSAGGNQ